MRDLRIRAAPDRMDRPCGHFFLAILAPILPGKNVACRCKVKLGSGAARVGEPRTMSKTQVRST